MRSLNIMDDVTFEVNRTAIYDIFEFIEFLKEKKKLLLKYIISILYCITFNTFFKRELICIIN